MVPKASIISGAKMSHFCRRHTMRSKYYEGKGWDKETGRPLPETLKKMGLESVINDLNLK